MSPVGANIDLLNPNNPRKAAAAASGYIYVTNSDPAAKAIAEQIAWSGFGNVSSNLQGIAAETLMANATQADVRRYTISYPGFQEQYTQYTAKLAASDTAP